MICMEIKQRRSKAVNKTKGRREKTDRRQKIKELIMQIDRRNIKDRRDTADRRLSKQKVFLFSVTQQGVTISGLKKEQEKLIKLIALIISEGDSNSYLRTADLLKSAYFALHSQGSKEEVLFQWYDETKNHFKSGSEYMILITQLNFILKKEMEDIIGTLDKYLSLSVDLDENSELFLEDMRKIQKTLITFNARKSKYVYPHYKEVLSLS